MLVYLRSYGQLCNRIWSLLPPLSLAIEKDEKLHVVFNNMNDLREFPNLASSEFVHTVTKYDKRVIASALHRLLAPLDIKCDLANAKVSRKIIYVINSWKHTSDKAYILKHKKELLDIFAFRPEVLAKVKSNLTIFDGVTVGVHIRRGDYQSWRGGAYYYDDNTYIRIMQSLASQFQKQGVKCRFLICSNEPFEADSSDLNIVRIPDASGMDDLCALSQCDYIVGPPSSFSQWASFYGDVPLHLILNAQEEIDINKFCPIVGMNVFQNGKRLIDVDGERFELQ